MIIEKNKTRWVSKRRLISLLNDSKLKQNIISIEAIKSEKIKGVKGLESFEDVNKKVVVVESKDFSLFIGLPFPFKEKSFDSIKGLLEILNKDITVGVLFFELGSWASGIIKYKEVLISKRGSRYIRGKHKAGGQSQRRFDRNREKWIEGLSKKVYEDIKKYILPEQSNIDYFVILGEQNRLNEFLKITDLSKVLKEKIILKKSSMKNYNSKTILKASSNLWSSKIYLDNKNAIVEKI
tara:strand:- start:3904 stop:4617 length:714 start_codon:yes stop_codon:yes gene_type:complete